MEVLLLKRKNLGALFLLTAFEASTTIFKRHCPVLRVETNLTLAQVEFGTKHVNVTVTFDEIMCCCCNYLCSHLESVEPLFFLSSFFILNFLWFFLSCPRFPWTGRSLFLSLSFTCSSIIGRVGVPADSCNDLHSGDHLTRDVLLLAHKWEEKMGSGRDIMRAAIISPPPPPPPDHHS